MRSAVAQKDENDSFVASVIVHRNVKITQLAGLEG
jgi:hypothetical protein